MATSVSTRTFSQGSDKLETYPTTALDAVFAAIVQAAEGGEPIDVLTWARRYPVWESEIAGFCADLTHFHQFLGLPQASSPTDTTVAQRSDRSRPELPERLLGERFGDYELIEVIGG